MFKEVKRKLLDAVMSGKYPRTKYVLKEDVGINTCYCLNGVICDISKLHKWKRNEAPEEELGKEFTYNDSGEHPPEDVLRWAGITETEAVWIGEENDHGTSWLEIIEQIPITK